MNRDGVDFGVVAQRRIAEKEEGTERVTGTIVVVSSLIAASSLAAQDAGSLAVHVQYPNEGATIGASDSTFVFGRVDGASVAEIQLTVNGTSVPVHEGGGWLAFVPIEPDTFAFVVSATDGRAEARTERTVWVPPPLESPAGPSGYKPETVEPRGPIEAYAGDVLRVGVVAAPGRRVAARIGDQITELRPEAGTAGHGGRLVFGDVGDRPTDLSTSAWRRYAGGVYLRLSGSALDTLFLEIGDREDGESVFVSEVRFLDPTERRVAVLDDDLDRTGRTDGRVVARAAPGRGYTMLLPNGTTVTLGRLRSAQREIVLAPGRTAWVAAAETVPIDAASPHSLVPVVRTRVRSGWSEVVVPLSARLPFRVEQHLDPARYTISIFGATTDTDWVRMAPEDPLIESVVWSQPGEAVYELDVRLDADQAWGYRARWEGDALVVGLRHPPPALDDRRFRSTLHGVKVVIDPGHSPDPGSIGPTGLEERNANLAISRELERILSSRGADVVMTRATADSALGLYDRTMIAQRTGGEIFVSIHNNALPDGVNPFVNNGTATFYYHPQSRPLAEAILDRLVVETGLSDYGVGEGNLAVVRMNEMPAVLVEGAFMMIPDQEARLRKPEFQRRIAMAVADGIERFLEDRNR